MNCVDRLFYSAVTKAWKRLENMDDFYYFKCA